MNAIFKYLKDSASKGNKAGELVLIAVKAGAPYADLIEAAKDVDAAYPVNKVDAKDINRADRNNLLSMLRMQMRRASAKAELPGVLSIKLVQGEYVVSLVTKSEATAEAGKDEQGGQDDAAGLEVKDGDEVGQDKLWSAAELVIANLRNPAILSAIRDALTKMAVTPVKA